MIAFLLLALALDVIRENPGQVGRGPDKPINEGCAWEGGRLGCAMLVGTHVYAVESNINHVKLTNRTNRPLSVERVATANAITGTWAEMSAYLDSFGGDENCPTPPWYGGIGGVAPCQKDLDPGPGLRLVGNVGAIYERADRHMAGLSWDPDALNVDPGSYVVLHDNPHGSPATMYTVTVRDGAGSLVFRQPKVDWSAYCSGKDEQSAWDPWVADVDMLITGAQVFSAGGNGRERVDGACLYVYAAGGGPMLWWLCGDSIATRGNALFTPRLVRKGESIVGHSINKCTGSGTWGYAVFITAKRSGS